MLRSYLIKILAVVAISSAVLAGCARERSIETGERPAFDPAPNRIPFSTREPDNFQAELVVTADESVRTTFFARSGEKRRVEFDFGKRSRIARIVNGKTYLVLPERSKFAELSVGAFSTDELSAFLTTRWLSESPDTTFEKLETVEGLTRYRAKFGESQLAEAVISVDDRNGMPVRQEFYSITDGTPTLTMTVEMRNFKLGADDSLFDVPNGFARVESSDLLKLKRGLENENE